MTTERYDSGYFTTYYGRALAVVRTDQPGIMTIRVSDGTESESCEIQVR